MVRSLSNKSLEDASLALQLLPVLGHNNVPNVKASLEKKNHDATRTPTSTPVVPVSHRATVTASYRFAASRKRSLPLHKQSKADSKFLTLGPPIDHPERHDARLDDETAPPGPKAIRNQSTSCCTGFARLIMDFRPTSPHTHTHVGKAHLHSYHE